MSDDRTQPKRVRLSGLQEAQLRALRDMELACTAMYHAIGFDAAEVPPRSEAELAALTRGHNVRVAEADHIVAGLMAWRDEAPGVAYIEELSVHPDFQRFGIATKLLDELRDEARSLGLGEVVVKCWSRATWARAFYAVAGFVEIGEAAPERVRSWREARSQGRPFTRPGELALWAPIGAAKAEPDDDTEEPA